MENTVKMSAQEQAEWEEYKKEKERKAAEESRRQQRVELQTLTDNVMDEAFAKLIATSESLKKAKKEIMDTFETLIEMRKEINTTAGKSEQNSYNFSNSKGDRRIRIGYNLLDAYEDSVEEGIAKVKEYIRGLAKDTETQQIVDMVLKLLAKDNLGNLKASRVMQLSKIAKDSGNADFIEGVQIIQQAYRPIRSNVYIRCAERKNIEGVETWVDIPLGMTES